MSAASSNSSSSKSPILFDENIYREKKERETREREKNTKTTIHIHYTERDKSILSIFYL